MRERPWPGSPLADEGAGGKSRGGDGDSGGDTVVKRVTVTTVTAIVLMMKLEFPEPASHAGNCVNPSSRKPHEVATAFPPLCKWQN